MGSYSSVARQTSLLDEFQDDERSCLIKQVGVDGS